MSHALVIPVQFSNTTFFSEGIAGVEINDKWGFINTSRKIVVQPVYDKIGHFLQGLAVVA
ncbi:WG repeat-containing protein [Sphingobacterium sp. ML3W]|uniref:WG repeat-containing protein n=1 Tax=Sphingobacterium sp. ML3W TaxID=1538644 RepID=UPI0038B4362E